MCHMARLLCTFSSISAGHFSSCFDSHLARRPVCGLATCNRYCPNGFKADSRGCNTCACSEWQIFYFSTSLTPSTLISTVTPPPLISPLIWFYLRSYLSWSDSLSTRPSTNLTLPPLVSKLIWLRLHSSLHWSDSTSTHLSPDSCITFRPGELCSTRLL